MEGASGTEGGIPPTAVVEKQLAIETQKEQLWQERKKEFTKDKLGHENDAGILDTVVGLSVVGVNTDKSCEGHIDSSGAPYIDVKAKDTLGIEQIYEMSSKEETRETAKKLSEETTRLNLKEREKLMGHLSAFYQNRQVSYDTRLTIQSKALGVSRLESYGAELQQIAPQEVKNKRLQEYQEEMRAFGEFLKQTYVSDAKIPTIPSVVTVKPEDQRIVEVPPVMPPVEKVEGLDEQVKKLREIYEKEKRINMMSMSPYWLALAEEINAPTDATRPLIRKCNLLLLKNILDDASKGLNGEGYQNNISKLTGNFYSAEKASALDQSKKTIISSISELGGSLDSPEAIGMKDEATGKILSRVNNRIGLSHWITTASLDITKSNKPEFGETADKKLAWILVGHTLEQYMQRYLSYRMTKER